MDENITERIETWLALDPERAADDAAADLAAGRVRIWWLAVEEVAEPIGVDRERVPENHETVWVGEGCIDPSNADDCPPAYRDAMDRAVAYGGAYNAVVVERVGAAPEVPARNRTDVFLGPEDGWAGAGLRLEDVTGPFGGRVISVDGGTAVVVTMRPKEGEPGLHTSTRTFPLDEEEWTRILRVFVEHDFLGIEESDGTAEPDTPRPRIVLTSPDGRSRELEAWLRPVPPPMGDLTPAQRFAAVHGAIVRLERRA